MTINDNYNGWKDMAQKLDIAADETNDAHDHDELHAAATICMWRGRGEYIYHDYVDRWIQGLIDKFVK